MILDFRNYKDIDFKSYSRVFIFGCSFTHYTWPTWANILSMETNEDTLIYNFGSSGAGNLYITERIASANQKYRFTDKDLVLIMWSTFSREDRYIENGWQTPGNIWTQDFYSKEFIKKYTCVRGYIIRDLGLMSTTMNSLQYLPCHAVVLKAVDPIYDIRYYTGDVGLDDVVDLYRDVIFDMPNCLYEFVKDGKGGWINGHQYHWTSISYSSWKTPFQDYHPNPKMYMEYLKNLGFNISDKNAEKVLQYNTELLDLKERTVIEKWFNNIVESNSNYFHNLHLI